MIEVKRAGFYTSVQDTGRPALRHLGVGLSGAMDPLALSVANLMLDNQADAAGLEITMGTASFVFREDTEIALAGAPRKAMLDGHPLQNWWARGVQAGQVLNLGAPREGVRSYLAIRGGLAVPDVLGSLSTDLKGGFGGLDGRPLRNGDMLSVHPTAPMARPNPGFGLCPWLLDPYAQSGDEGSAESPSETPTIHVLPAAQWEDLTPDARLRLTDTEWRISPQSNRVGCLLEGPELSMPARHEMRSHGIMPGVIQLPPSGRPMVQLCDGNTSGGYPVVATVIRTDLHRFAQLRPGSGVRFEACDIAQAQALLAERERFMDDLAMRCKSLRERLR